MESSSGHRPAAASEPASAADRDSLLTEISELRSAVQARDEFISMIVHEVRNPLTPLLMQTSSLSLLAAKHPSTHEKIVRGIETLNMIVEHLMRRTSVLLDISRMSSGMYRLAPAEVSASDILLAAVSRMQLEAQVAGSELRAEVQPDVHGWWDPLAFEQIADNLISNAIKYGEGHPIAVHFACRNNLATLRVSDHGMGISADNLERIFDRFERAVYRGRASGFGIGLWLVGRLVDQMGGKIDINSVLGDGTTINVSLPTKITEPKHD